MFAPSHVDSARLDALIQKLKDSGAGDAHELLVEHLQTAHAYLLGAMPEECEHNLRMALQAADALPDKALQKEVKDTIAALSRAEPPEPLHSSRVRAPLVHFKSSEPRLEEYFHGSDDASFGIFYPKKHVVAVFPRLETAELGCQALFASGFRIWEVIAVPGEQVEKFLNEMKQNRTVWDGLLVELSRALDTEACLVDRYADWARKGSAFLIAFSATEEDAEAVAEILKPLAPSAMHWFAAGYIQHLLPTG